MADIPSLKDWPTGPVLPLGEHLQETVDAARKLADEAGLDLRKKRETILGHRWIGKIVNKGPNGESDYDDERYWVKRQLIASDDDPTANFDLNDDTTFTPTIYTATNIAVADTGEHGYLKGKYVRVDGWLDGGGQSRWSFFAPPPRPIYVHLSVNSGSNGTNDPIVDATYTYDLLNPDTDDPLDGATNLTPAGNRERGELTGPATIGQARIAPDGTWTLFWTDERAQILKCPT